MRLNNDVIQTCSILLRCSSSLISATCDLVFKWLMLILFIAYEQYKRVDKDQCHNYQHRTDRAIEFISWKKFCAHNAKSHVANTMITVYKDGTGRKELPSSCTEGQICK